MPTQDEISKFLKKIDDTHKKVHDICNGNVDLDEFEIAEHKAWKLDQTKEEIKIREARAEELKGRKGKGH